MELCIRFIHFICTFAKKKELINNLEDTFRRIQKEFLVPAGDFPEISRMKKLLSESDFNEFPQLNESMLAIVDDMMRYDVPQLMKKLPQEQRYKEAEEETEKI